jgi:hypothetical protein
MRRNRDRAGECSCEQPKNLIKARISSIPANIFANIVPTGRYAKPAIC